MPVTDYEENAVATESTETSDNTSMMFDNLDDLFAQIENNATNQDRLEWKLSENEVLSGVASLCKREDKGDKVIYYAPDAEVMNAMKVMIGEEKLDFVEIKLSA